MVAGMQFWQPPGVTANILFLLKSKFMLGMIPVLLR